MYKRARRFKDYVEARNYETSVSNLPVSECYPVAYYLFELTKNVPNEIFFESNYCITIINQLSSSLGLNQRIKKVLEEGVESLVQKGLLHPLDEEEILDDTAHDDLSPREIVHRRRIKICNYVEDEDLCRTTDFENSDETNRNLFRMLSTDEKGTYAQIIYNTFFTTAAVNFSKRFTQAPVRFVRMARDTTRMDFLKKELGLTEIEAGYLLLRYRKATVENLNEIFNSLTNNSKELYPRLLGITKSEYTQVIRPDQKIRQFGFMAEDRTINPTLLECIEACDLSLYFADCIKTIDLNSTYELDSFCVPKKNSAIYKSMLKSSNPISVLLYGQPGSGKTEYAKALVKSSGKKALIFKNEAEIIDKNDAIGRLNCLLSLNRKDTVLIVDEADDLLSTAVMSFFGPIKSSATKGVVNKMLENSQNKVIWIINHKGYIDESTLRRFTVSYKFEAMSPMMLENIAEKKLEAINVTSETKKKILDMLSCYKVTGSSVDNMIKAINSMNKKDEDLLLQNIEIVLKDNSLLLHGRSKMRETVNPSYDISVLNTSMPAEKIVRMLKNAKAFADKNPGSGAIRMLFYGLSGTGKTEFARYISQVLGKRVLLKRASDILSRYVGGTEEQIAAAFSEAAANDMILLCDEADSFFASRENAHNSWERTQVNEFLTQMEEFPGIVICTTNLREIMDAAMLRRFHITVDFKALNEEGINKLLEKYFPEMSFEKASVKKLLNYNTVTPGDFGRLCGTVRFIDPEEVTAEYIIEELCKIQEEKKNGENSSRIMGFCA